VTGEHHDQDSIDLGTLTTDQLQALTCVNCNHSGGATRAIVTPGNLWNAHVVAHTDIGVCVRHIARYVANLHMSVVEASEAAVATLDRVTDLDGDDPEGAGPRA
jgi:hypothetical protein